MTVMFITDVLIKLGGAERSLYLLSRELQKQGHRVIICTLRGGELSQKIQQKGFFVENLDITKICSFKGLKALFRMVEIARHERASVIISYHESSDYLGLLVALLARVPIVSSRRDMGFKLKPKHIWVYRLINRFFDQIVTVSSAVRETIAKSQWTRPSDIMVIHNGVDSSTSRPWSLEGPNDIRLDAECLKIFCLANIRPIKGQRHLVEAASLVIKQFPNVRLFFIGDYDMNDPYFAELRNRIRDLGLETPVKFTGELRHSHVRYLLASMDICALPSLSEGMSNALLESMSAGKPVVATAVGGNPELVEDGKTGYLVPPGNPKSMAEALLKLLASPDLRHKMGLRAKSLVESEFGLARMVESYEDVLKYVVLRRKFRRWQGLRFRLTRTTQQVKSWAKVLVTSMVYYSGLVVAFRSVKRALHLGRVKILCLHDVSELAGGRDHFSILMPPQSFSGLVDFLAENCQIVSLREAVSLQESRQPLTDDVFALTFDDCYKGWIDHVFPKCQRLQVPYTIFVATEPLDSGRPLLYDTLIYLAENSWRKVADLSPWRLGVFFLDNPDNIFRFVEEMHDYWRTRSREDRDQFLQDLAGYLGVSLDYEKFQNIILTWDDVRKMDMHGVTIGAHSVSHSCLRDLPEAVRAREISQSKKRLEEELGHPVRFFAYPYGAQDYDERDKTNILAEAGFQYAFTLGVMDRNQLEPFEIGRLGFSPDLFVGPNSNFHKPLLATELCGLGDILFGRVFRRKAG